MTAGATSNWLSCLVAAWLILRGPLRQLSEEVHAERARELFRQRLLFSHAKHRLHSRRARRIEFGDYIR